MKNAAKKITKAVFLVLIMLVATIPLVAHAEWEEPISSEITIRSKMMHDGIKLLNVMGEHDEVILKLSELQSMQEGDNVKSVFLISCLNETRNTEAHIFIAPTFQKLCHIRLQYEGTSDMVRIKKDELKENGYEIEGHVEFLEEDEPTWAKVIATKRIKR